jgi:hypothetical protein
LRHGKSISELTEKEELRKIYEWHELGPIKESGKLIGLLRNIAVYNFGVYMCWRFVDYSFINGEVICA